MNSLLETMSGGRPIFLHILEEIIVAAAPVSTSITHVDPLSRKVNFDSVPVLCVGSVSTCKRSLSLSALEECSGTFLVGHVLAFDRHTELKWFCFPQALQVFPRAGQVVGDWQVCRPHLVQVRVLFRDVPVVHVGLALGLLEKLMSAL